MTFHHSSIPVTPAAEGFILAGGRVGIMIIHGYGGSIGDYRDIGRQLNTAGYTVVGVRLAGHGQTPEALRATQLPDWQHSVDEALTQVKEQCDRVIILGSSFGGVLALDAALRHPDEVNGLVLVNTALSYVGGGRWQGMILRLLRLFTPDYPKFGLSREEKTKAQEVGSALGWPINGVLATAKFAQDVIVPKLSSITVPTLILASAKDGIVGPENSQKIYSTIASIHKQQFVIPVATHRPFRHPEAISFMVKAITAFLDQAFGN